MSLKDPSEFINHLQSNGRYSFSRKEASESTALEPGALRKALWRLEDKNRIRMIKRGFYVIVPLEYSRTRVIPADWFVAELMRFLGKPYYVGLLSAAALYGAAHQQPQEFHIVVPKPERDILVEGLRIRFFKKGEMQTSPVEEAKTTTGYMRVSNPAVTAIDLVSYSGRIGGLDRVFTVLQELVEMVTSDMLIQAANNERQLSRVQRLGWLLEQIGKRSLVSTLEDWILQKRPTRTPLDPAQPRKGFVRNVRWNVIENSDVEGEL